MRSTFLSMTWALVFVFTVNAQAQEGTAGTSTTPTATGTVEAPSPPVERAKPAEKPTLEKSKPIEKPRVVETPSKPETTTAKAAETPVLGAPVPNPPSSVPTAVQPDVSFPCMALAFAMLILGAAAGFIGRHLMSRHKLGGMTVRVGTWRGIP